MALEQVTKLKFFIQLLIGVCDVGRVKGNRYFKLLEEFQTGVVVSGAAHDACTDLHR